MSRGRIKTGRDGQLVRLGFRRRFLGSLVLVGGALLVALHAVSDIGIAGVLGAKLASFGSQHDQGVACALYLLTFGVNSVGTCSAG